MKLTEDDPIEKKSMKLYSAFDLQCNQYFHSGRNSTTKEDCMINVAEMLVGGQDEFTWEEFEKSAGKQSVNEYIVDLFDVRIDEHNGRIDENGMESEKEIEN